MGTRVDMVALKTSQIRVPERYTAQKYIHTLVTREPMGATNTRGLEASEIYRP